MATTRKPKRDCEVCGGDGYVNEPYAATAHTGPLTTTCAYCNGEGRITGQTSRRCPTKDNPIAPPAAVLALADQGLNSTEIAEHFGVSRQRISQILQANGISPKAQQAVRQEANRRQAAKNKQARAMARQGRRLQKQTRRAQLEHLANQLGVTAHTLASFADCTGPYRKPTVRTVERSSNSLPNRWTPDGELLAQQVKAIATPWTPRHLTQNREKAAW